MRELVQCGQGSYLLSVQIALDAAGIPYAMDPPEGQALPDVINRVLILRDADYERARTAVESVERTRDAGYPVYVVATLVLLGLTLVVIVLRAILHR